MCVSTQTTGGVSGVVVSVRAMAMARLAWPANVGKGNLSRGPTAGKGWSQGNSTQGQGHSVRAGPTRPARCHVYVSRHGEGKVAQAKEGRRWLNSQ